MLRLWKPVPFSLVAVALTLLWVFVISPISFRYLGVRLHGLMNYAAILGTPAVIVISIAVYLLEGNYSWREGLTLVSCLLGYIGFWVYALLSVAMQPSSG